MTSEATHHALTLGDPNPIKRYLQRRRFYDALSVVKDQKPNYIIDYGAGNGQFFPMLNEKYPQAKDLKGQSADVIFCFEGLEHLPPKPLDEAISNFARLLKPDGVLVVGIPIETGPIAYIKGAFRAQRRPNDFDADPMRIKQAAQGKIAFDRFQAPFGDGLSYYPHHLGFDYRDCLKSFEEDFVITRKMSSPFGLLPPEFNTELTLTLKKRKSYDEK